MKIIKWNPFNGKSLFEDEFLFNFPTSKIGWDLAVDVYEKNGNIIAEMNIPGVEPQKIDISIEGDILRLSGSREEEKETKDKNYYSKEIQRGSFERIIQLPSTVIAEKAEAQYKEGVLKITMPKKANKEGGKVKLKVSDKNKGK